MSIIRSNIARQLLAEGGAPRASFRSGGREDAESQYGSGSVGSYSYSEPTSVSGGDYEDDVARMEASMNINQPPGSLSDEDAKALSYVNFNRPTRTPDRFTFGIPEGFSPFPILTGITKGIQGIDNFIGKATNRDRYNLSRRTDFLRKEGVIGPGEEDEKYTDEFLLSPEGLDMLKGMGYTTIQDVINNRGEGGDSEPIKRLRAPITEKIEEEPKKSDIENLLAYRGSAFEDGGEVRDGYFGGGITKAFKKAVGAVKKVAKSPIGKAALIGGLGFLGSKTAVGGDLFTKFKALSPIQKALLVGGTAATLSPFAMKDEEEEETLPTVANTDPAFQNLINYYGGSTRFAAEGGDIDEAPMKDMPQQEMASNPSSFAELNMLSLDLFGRPYDQLNDSEQEILMEYFSKSKDMPERTMAAGGGMMNPNDEMLNLGGNEMDLRGGGFVPLGEYEKKDDVPARLSKNEFVFTADAVKAAGGGSVDRGADIMYKTMKNLENKIA